MRPFAQWSPARDVWETDQVCICGHSDVFSETFPSSGMWAGGTAYALPTSERRTDVSASSSLPTPPATRGGSATETVALLPTPDASPEKYRLRGDSQQSRSLPAMAIRGELG